MRPNRLKILAQERGLSVEELLIQAYETHGSQQKVASVFEISQSRISQLIREHALMEKTVLVKVSAS
jgi:predicted XRE-type DNA-binding protein